MLSPKFYMISLHDALPIYARNNRRTQLIRRGVDVLQNAIHSIPEPERSEEHTSELQSPCNLVCRLLLEKKKVMLSASMPLIYDTNIAYNLFDINFCCVLVV